MLQCSTLLGTDSAWLIGPYIKVLGMQIDMHILNPSFDQGADQRAWNRWMGSQGQ